jgi:two-component system alkaline phosphatase synthesis response regulator PhoP
MTRKEMILIVEDEDDIRELLHYHLTREGYRVIAVATGEEAIRVLPREKPDLIVLDLMLPGIDGFEVCRQVRRGMNGFDPVIIMLTARGEEIDVVTGLEIGADDYITKPFSPKVLIARIRARLRQSQAAPVGEDQILSMPDMQIDPRRHEVLIQGQKVDLTNSEFKILHFLARKPGWVFSRYQIVDAVHGTDYPVTERSIDVQIVSLRRKLGGCGIYIETVRGVGYRCKEPTEMPQAVLLAENF